MRAGLWRASGALRLAPVLVLGAALLAPATAGAIEPTGEIAGTVTSVATKMGVEQAKVCVATGGGLFETNCTKTGAGGKYTIEGLAPGLYELEFSASGLVTQYYKDQTTRTHETVEVKSALTTEVNAELASPPPPPTVSEVTPNHGPEAGGTPVTIKGSGFVEPATVTIGSAATDVHVVSETEIDATTTATAAGADEVVVKDANGTSTSGPPFTYEAPPPPPPPNVTLTILQIGDGSGTVTSSPEGINCPPACNHEYPEGQRLVLTATPAPGSFFGSWLGDLAGNAYCNFYGPCETELKGTATIRVNFFTFGGAASGNSLAGEGGGLGGGSRAGAGSHVPDATLASSSLTVSPSGAVVLRIKCPVGETSCIGTATLTSHGAIIAGAAKSNKKKKPATLTYGKAAFRVPGGTVKSVTLHLSSKARKLLARSHSLKANATLQAHDPAGASHTTRSVVTLRLKAKQARAKR